MKAIPMRGRLTGKRIAGYLWAGQGVHLLSVSTLFDGARATEIDGGTV